ncbi:MAG: putative ABC transporter permease [Roseburia sp.]|nr:putative ABC transporter permease [Roseburia sp.]
MKTPINPLPFQFLKNSAADFLRCGVIGWCIEIIFTALGALRRREMQLMGQTSLWMFPIYGCAALFKPLFLLIRKCPTAVRGLIYALCIFTGEYTGGRLLDRHALCPWNYNRSKWHVKGLIRLDFLPFWCLAGLLFERVLTARNADTAPHDPQYSANCPAHGL